MKDWNWNRIGDWVLSLTIVFVMCAMLGAPIWICWLQTDCVFAS